MGNYPLFDAEQISQCEQDNKAGDQFLFDAVRNKIGHIYANHSKGES